MSDRMGGSQYAARARFRAAADGHRRRIRGDRAVRQLLKQIPDAARDEMVGMLEQAGDNIVAAQRAESPSTRIRAALSRRVSPRTMRLRAGLIGRPLNRRLFFARILEFGRKAQTVTARRAGGQPYTMRVRAMTGRRFIYGRGEAFQRLKLRARLNRFWAATIERAAHGISDA